MCFTFYCSSVLFWDTRPSKMTSLHMMQAAERKKQEVNNPIGVPTTFKHLDLTWKPTLRVQLFKAEPGGDHAPTKFSISEMQGKKQGQSAR